MYIVILQPRSISSLRISKTSIIADNSAVLLDCLPLILLDTFLLSPSLKYTPIPAFAVGLPLLLHAPSVNTLICSSVLVDFLVLDFLLPAN